MNVCLEMVVAGGGGGGGSGSGGGGAGPFVRTANQEGTNFLWRGRGTIRSP